MIKNASRLWGYHDSETESSFDPLVGLLIGALAAELEKISGENPQFGIQSCRKTG